MCGSSTRSLSRILTFQRILASNAGSFKVNAIAASSALLALPGMGAAPLLNYVPFFAFAQGTYPQTGSNRIPEKKSGLLAPSRNSIPEGTLRAGGKNPVWSGLIRFVDCIGSS